MIESCEIDFKTYLHLTATTREHNDNCFSIINGVMTELIRCRYDGAYCAFVTQFEALNTPRPDYNFTYNESEFIGCTVFEYTGSDSEIEVRLEELAKNDFLDKLIKCIGA